MFDGTNMKNKKKVEEDIENDGADEEDEAEEYSEEEDAWRIGRICLVNPFAKANVTLLHAITSLSFVEVHGIIWLIAVSPLHFAFDYI